MMLVKSINILILKEDISIRIKHQAVFVDKDPKQISPIA